jgi:hypothetical protein
MHFAAQIVPNASTSGERQFSWYLVKLRELSPARKISLANPGIFSKPGGPAIGNCLSEPTSHDRAGSATVTLVSDVTGEAG